VASATGHDAKQYIAPVGAIFKDIEATTKNVPPAAEDFALARHATDNSREEPSSKQ
jgi:hypothetical protein